MTHAMLLADAQSLALAFLQDLAIVMIVAGLVTVVFHRLRQPVVLGYILAGLIIGPYTPPFPLIPPEHKPNIEFLAELGVIFLMFGLGLHFSLRQLVKVGATAFIGATLEIIVMAFVGFQLGRLFGWRTMDSIFLGAILSMSSTTIIIKALSDLGMMKKRFAELIFGILIVEDILAMAMLALLSGIAATGSLNVGDVLKTLAELSIFLAVLLVVGLLTVPWLLRYVARFKSDEMLLVAVLGICFGVSLLAAKLDYSVALGAFIIGAIMAEAREAGKIETLIAPIRDMFSAVFFVAVGMLIDPRLLGQYAWPIVIVTIAVVAVKVPTCAAGAFLAGNDTRTSLRAGMGLAQIGEFSFIIAQLGVTLGVTSNFLYPVVVMVSAITTLLTPYLIRSSDRAVGLLERLAPNTVLGYLDTYHRWVSDLVQSARGGNQIRKLLRKWALQIALNVALISGILIAAKSIAIWAEKQTALLPAWTGGPRAVTWLAAMLLALPLLVATFRKMRAVTQVLAELSVPRKRAQENTAVIRAGIANAILIPATLAVGIWVLALSAALLPPWPVFVGLLVLIGAITAVMWNHFIKVYATAQISLKTTLTQERPPPEDEQRPISRLLRDARMETIEITTDSPAAGKLIRELQLRTRTGASAVGIERNGNSVINPGPDEELQAGDQVLLLGDADQLASARRLLAKA